MKKQAREEVIPILEEKAFALKTEVETGKVRVRTVTEETSSIIEEELMKEDVEVVRVPVDRPVDRVPDVREEDGAVIIPVVEEVLVIEKRLVLKEEVHVRRRAGTVPFAQEVRLRAQRPVIERERLNGTRSTTK